MKNIEKTLHLYQDELRAKGLNPIYTALFGSQNYGLDTENSDIDIKVIVLPTLHDLALNKQPISQTFEGEDGLYDVKDIRLMFQNFKKQNINFLEILFTPYFLVNEEYSDLFLTLRARANEIAHYNPFVALKCMYGMANEKFRKMEHISPASEEKIKQFGYDPKQLHHIVRLREFAERYANGEDFSACLKTNHQSYLLRLKEGKFSLSDARAIASAEIIKLDSIVNEAAQFDYESDKEVEVLLNETVYNAMRRSFARELA